MAGMAIYGAIQGARKSSAEKSTQNLSNTMSTIAMQQHTMAQPALQKAMQYYMTLAGGNRGQIQGAIAPQLSALNASYKGAETRMGMMPAGPTRDRQMAELQRQKAGQIGMLPIEARNDAMQRLYGFGQEQDRSALGYYNQSANLLPQLNAFEQQRKQNYSDMGATLFNIFQPQIAGKAPWPSLKYGSGTKSPQSSFTTNAGLPGGSD
jgi:hypothetical protein